MESEMWLSDRAVQSKGCDDIKDYTTLSPKVLAAIFVVIFCVLFLNCFEENRKYDSSTTSEKNRRLRYIIRFLRVFGIILASALLVYLAWLPIIRPRATIS